MKEQSNPGVKSTVNSLRSSRKKTVNIFVSEGSFSDPFYNFEDKKGRAIETFKLNPNKKYRFRRADNASSHPFYISDQGFKQPASNKIKLKGDGRFDNGISGKEDFTLSFKKKHRHKFASSGKLFFYCTSHSSMIGQFQFKKNRRGALNRPPELNFGKSESTFHADVINRIPSTWQTGTYPVESHGSWGHQNTFAIQTLSTASNNEFGKFISQQQEIY